MYSFFKRVLECLSYSGHHVDSSKIHVELIIHYYSLRITGEKSKFMYMYMNTQIMYVCIFVPLKQMEFLHSTTCIHILYSPAVQFSYLPWTWSVLKFAHLYWAFAYESNFFPIITHHCRKLQLNTHSQREHLGNASVLNLLKLC